MGNKIHVLACLYGRRKVTEIFALGIERLRLEFDVSVTTVASNDEDFTHAESMGLNPILHDNFPLGAKHNKGLSHSLKQDWDYLLVMGSDNLISNEGLKLLLSQKRSYVGFRNMLAYEPSSGECYLFEYAINDFLIGAGRLISREAVENANDRSIVKFKIGSGRRAEYMSSVVCTVAGKQLEKKGGFMCSDRTIGLWDNDLNRGLDGSSDKNLLLSGISRTIIESEFSHILDIKTVENINQIGSLYTNGAETIERYHGRWDWFLSDKEKRAIEALRS